MTESTSAAPPTMPGRLGSNPGVWHQVIGVISIVLGILGTLSNLWQAVSVFVAAPLMRLFSIVTGAAGAPSQVQSQQTAMADVMALFRWPTLIFAGMACMASVVLIVAGVRGVQRDPRTARLHSIYAPLRVVAAIGMFVTTLLLQPQMMATMGAAQGGVPAGMTALVSVMQVLGAVVALLAACAYPVFVFIWFRRDAIRRQVATWPAKS